MKISLTLFDKQADGQLTNEKLCFGLELKIGSRGVNTRESKLCTLALTNTHTNPRESKAEIRNSMAPSRLSNKGMLAKRMLNASFLEVNVLVLRTFCRSIADSTERPSKTVSIFCNKFHKSISHIQISQSLQSIDHHHIHSLHD